MNVVCPACKEQHRVSDQMAGKRAKCSCGEVMTIPVAPAPAATADTTPTVTSPPSSGVASQTGHEAILFQCPYGVFRRFMWWLMGGNFFIALALIPAGFLWNKGWELNGAPLPPWGAMLLFEGVGFGLLLLIAYVLSGYFLHRDKPQRVAVTADGVILPKGKLSKGKMFIPWAEVRVKHWGGPVEQLDFKRGFMKSCRLTSIQFATDDDFEAFYDYLREHDKV